MKIAVCFGGIIRTGTKCDGNIRRFIGELWPNCDFFIHTWDYETTKPLVRKTWNGVTLAERPSEMLDLGKLQIFLNIYQPKLWKIDSYHEFIRSNTKTRGNIVWHTMARSFKLKAQYEADNNFKYDIVVKIRPDVMFTPSRRLSEEIANLNFGNMILYSDCYTDLRLDDVFWLSNTVVTDKMMDLPDYLNTHEPSDISHKHNEIVLRYLSERNIDHRPTAKRWPQYTIYRPESYMFDPMIHFEHCFNMDRIHYSNAHSEDEFKTIFKNESRVVGLYD